jgi:hypothetical protein
MLKFLKQFFCSKPFVWMLSETGQEYCNEFQFSKTETIFYSDLSQISCKANKNKKGGRSVWVCGVCGACVCSCVREVRVLSLWLRGYEKILLKSYLTLIYTSFRSRTLVFIKETSLDYLLNNNNNSNPRSAHSKHTPSSHG